jgi:predicted transposase YdaD
MTENIEKSTPTETSVTGGQYDTVSKNVIQQNPEDWIRFGLGVSDVHVIQILDTEQPTVKSNRADSFIHANVNGRHAVIHFEIQTRDSTQIPMPYRIAGYAGRCIESFRLPVYSHVIYLHPDAGRNDPGQYVQEMPGYNILIQYKVIRLYELEGQNVLDAKIKGLIPFAPLMKPKENTSSEEWLRQCVQVAKSVTQNVPHQADYLTNLGILGGIILDYETIRAIILEETMQESSVIQHFTQQGIEQGMRKGTIDAILEVLEEQLQSEDVQTLKPILEQIEELQSLKQLLREAARANSLEAFKETLPE